MVSDLDIYLFDVHGYLLLKGALSTDEISAMNACIDAIPQMKPGEWHGYVHAQQFSKKNGINLQQIYEAGEPFERLIDHPAWIDKVKHFVGGEGTFDWKHGPLFIDENFASLRGPGEGIFPHSGGAAGVTRCQFRCLNQTFHCGQINILMALTDIGDGDGPTVVIPGSHKANFQHPALENGGAYAGGENTVVADLPGSQAVHMEAGDVLLFVDAIMHGAEEKKTPGQRRIVVYRYGPSWGNFRHGYRPSPELLERLTPERRQFVQPHEVLPREPQVKSS